MQKSTIAITFGSETVEPSGHISIELDSDKNEGKTSFDIDVTAYLKVYYNEAYTYESSGGTLKKVATNILLDIEDEKITFAATSEAYLAYLPSGTVNYSWVGDSAGSPVFDGRKVSVSESVVAVLKCSYKSKGDRLSLSFNEEGQVVVVVVEGTAKASTTVNFATDEDEDAEPVPYRIKVIDYCSGDSLPSVTVTITTAGSPMDGEVLVGGNTDANGEVYLGMLIPGRQYDLKMSRSDYLSSELDQLNNDYFIVPN